jgi:6-phosphogluconolactonase
MKILKINKQSEHYINTFSSFEELAFLTAPYLVAEKVALSGGNTYKKLFEYWLNFKSNLTNTEFFPVDERMVPFNSEDSNWGTAFKLFLSKVGRESDKINFPVSKENYELILKNAFKNNLPIFNTIFLGVGNDGHTASLFPCGKELEDLDSLVLQTKSPIPPYDRITLGSSVITSADELIVIVAGESKKEIFQRMLQVDERLPIVKILSRYNNAAIFVDSALSLI